MLKIVNFLPMALFMLNVSNAQTISQNNFVELYDGVWNQYGGVRGQPNFNLYLEANKNNLGVQIKTSGDLSVSLSSRPFYPNAIPWWICKRDLTTEGYVNIDGDKYCQSNGQLTWYKTSGALQKINDTTYDVFSNFNSQRNESSVKYILDVFVVEDSIYYKQNISLTRDTMIYHRNVVVGYFRVPSGVVPNSLVANRNYYFKNRIKMKAFSNEKKLSVFILAYDSLNKKYLNASNSTALFSEDPEICMVTADSSNRNNIIWQPLSGKGKVYFQKETNITNQYVIIDSASSSKPRIFIDKNSNAAIKPESYRLIFKDTSAAIPGVKFRPSNPSATHKTMHLSINKGTGNDWNLIWSSYGGFPVVSYDIYRRFGSGAWSKIGSVSGSVNSYTDLNVSGSNVAYKISVVSPNACDPNAWARLSSESNIADQNYSKNVRLHTNDLSIQPNPAENNLIMLAHSRVGFIKQYQIKDLTGRVISSAEVNNIQARIDVSSLKPGSYMVTAFFGNGEICKQFIRL